MTPRRSNAIGRRSRTEAFRGTSPHAPWRWGVSLVEISGPLESRPMGILGYVGCSVDITRRQASLKRLFRSDRRKTEFWRCSPTNSGTPCAHSQRSEILRQREGDREAVHAASEMMERQVGRWRVGRRLSRCEPYQPRQDRTCRGSIEWRPPSIMPSRRPPTGGESKALT